MSDVGLMRFVSEEFGLVRAVELDGKPWFVGKDIAAALGYVNTKKAIADHVDEEDKLKSDGVPIRDPMGRNQHPIIINESGLYSLILSSKLPGARRFKRWVTSEVLPSVRRRGAYLSDKALEEFKKDPDSIVRLSRAIVQEHEQRLVAESRCREMEPKARLYDMAMESSTTLTLSQCCAVLGLPFGNVTLVRRLRDMGVLKPDNTPVREYLDNGCFAVRERPIRMRDGTVRTLRSTRVYQRGLDWLCRIFSQQI